MSVYIHYICAASRDGDRVLKCPTCNIKPSKKFDDAVIPDRTLQNMVDTFSRAYLKTKRRRNKNFMRSVG